jgi:hypothetical protein
MKRGPKPRGLSKRELPCRHPRSNRIIPSFRVFACPDCFQIAGIVRVESGADDLMETVQPS